MEIKTTANILKCYNEEDDREGVYDNKWWVDIDNNNREINDIRNAIRDCSFEDDFGEQCFKYCDLHNMFKILESELHKPKINGQGGGE